jgi:RNA polymerase sigma-70 factor (ECF subfamily)
MPSVPETRASLILRLPDAEDVEAWDEFVEIYQPFLYRMARRQGFQDADAHEMVQEVLAAVARAVDRWVPDRSRGRFRDWLFRIARNFMINFISRPKHRALGSGDSNIARLLEQQCDPTSEPSREFELEYRREIFRQAAARVQPMVTEVTWQAFWQSSVLDRPIAEVAKELNISRGSVYIARSRVMSRLKEQVQSFETR